jgi:hypothetical protein
MSHPEDRGDLGSGGGDARADLDADLRESFAALRRQEEATATRVETLSKLAAGRRQPSGLRRRLRPLVIAAASAAVAGAALIVASSGWLRTHVPQSGSSVGPVSSITSISRWRPGTDFLLRTPGQEVLTKPPAFGSSSIGIELGLGGALADRRDVHRRP